MNKARMTIRFDHDPPKEREKDQAREERDMNLRASSRNNDPVNDDHHMFDEYDTMEDRFANALDDRGRARQDHLRVVPPPDEDRLHDQDWRTSQTHRTKGRLAEERRLLNQADNWQNNDGSEITDTYRNLHDDTYESVYDTHMERVPNAPVNDQRWEMAPESGPYDSSVDEDEYGYYRTRKPTSFWKMAVSVTAAVITGLLFGYMVLSMFNGGSTGGESASPIEGNVTGSQAPAGSSEGTGTSQTPVINETALNIPGQTFYMLQYGVFSTPERAEQAKGELLQSGIAAGGDLEDENRVYAGISPDREQAKLLSNQLKAEGVELYVKEISLPNVESAAFAGEEQALTDYFAISGQLVSELSTLSASLLGKQEAGAAAPESMNTITNLHQQWIQAVKLLSAGLGPESGASLPAMEQSMNSSITALSEYNKNQSKGHLWEIQTGMMNYIVGQKKLLDGL